MLVKVSEGEEIYVDPAEIVSVIGTLRGRTQIGLRHKLENIFVNDPPAEVLKRLWPDV